MKRRNGLPARPRDAQARLEAPRPPRAPSPAQGARVARAADADAGPLPDLELTHGARAALAILEARPGDVRRVWLTAQAAGDEPRLRSVAERARLRILRAADAELGRLVHTPNHEGVVVEAAERPWLSVGELAERLVAERGLCVVLDRVRNPHNVGAIVRSAAFFGASAVLLGSPAPHPGLAPDAVRVAEGGAERLAFARTTDLAGTLDRLKSRGVRVVGAESDVRESLFGADLAGPVAVVVGHEVEGIAPRVRARCDAMVTIPGTGAVGSLNVAISASLFVAEWARRRAR
jgi:TrmH RNA methyltransferase